MTGRGPKAHGYSGKSANRSRQAGARVYQAAVRALSLVFVALGAVVLVTTLVNGGGPASVGVLIGIAFLAVGIARLWVSARMSR